MIPGTRKGWERRKGKGGVADLALGEAGGGGGEQPVGLDEDDEGGVEDRAVDYDLARKRDVTAGKEGCDRRERGA